MRKRDIKAHRWVRVRYDDVGVRDAIVIETCSRWIEIYVPNEGTDMIEASQVVCMGPRLDNVPEF